MPSCEVYVVRHAIAAERGPDWPDDRQRPLTARGAGRFTEVVAGLRWMDVAIDEIFTSPLVRARQTADLLSAGLAGGPGVTILPELAPGHSPAEVMARLSQVGRRNRLALVGHEPGQGELAAHLIGAGRALAFRKGAVCRIDMPSLSNGEAGALRWFLTPKVLRRLGRSDS
jgi:phosphohistidine phosphatase